MNNKNKYKKLRELYIQNRSIKYTLIIAIIIISFCLIAISARNYNNINKVKVYYRTYTKENGWSRWSKNGEISGNGKYNILNIEVKVKSRISGGTVYSVYQKKDWVPSTKKIGVKPIYGFKASLYDYLHYEYSLYYRTYNKKDKWLEWSYGNNINGNKDEPITKIQIKSLHSDITLEDYLEDYRTKEIQSVGFDKVGDLDE